MTDKWVDYPASTGFYWFVGQITRAHMKNLLIAKIFDVGAKPTRVVEIEGYRHTLRGQEWIGEWMRIPLPDLSKFKEHTSDGEGLPF